MSLPSSSEQPQQPRYRKPRADIYTLLLLLALLALLLGILCLYFEMDLYNFEYEGGPVPMAAVSQTVIASPAVATQLAGQGGVAQATMSRLSTLSSAHTIPTRPSAGVNALVV